MKEKRLGRYFEIGAIILLFVLAIGCEIGRGSGNKEIGTVEKLEYKVSGKLKEQILEIWVAGLKGAHRETVLDGGKEVGSSRLNIDPEQAEFLVIDNRGKASLLGYADKETFLRDFGFEGKEPFYQYVDEESGMLWMELYSKLTYDGYDPSQSAEIEDFNEKTEYTADGKMKHYIATGWMTYMSDEKDISTLVEMDFVYREDGTLQRKDRSHNWAYGGTWYSMIHSCYGNKERLIFEDCYVTHGSMDYYYIYEGDEDEPSYYLVIDHDLGDLYAEMYSCHDITGEENGKCYGKIGPDLSDNSYVQAAMGDRHLFGKGESAM